MFNDTVKSVVEYDNHSILHQFSDTFSENGGPTIKCKGLGEKFVTINSFFLDYLKEYHLPVAFLKVQNKNSLRYFRHEKFQFYVKVLNICDKRTAKIFNKKEGALLSLPIYEYHFCNGKDSMISESHIVAFNLCSLDEILVINRICSKVNAVLKSFFERRNSTLGEVCCLFGKTENKIFLIDDFTPSSLKVIVNNKNHKSIDPYKLNSAPVLKNYTDLLQNFLNNTK